MADPLKYTADDLIRSIRIRAKLPDQNLNLDNYNDADILRIINEELVMEMVPTIIEKQEEYFVRTTATPIVTDQLYYRIPERAIGNKLRDLAIEESNGTLWRSGRNQREDRIYLKNSYGKQRFVYLEGNDIVFPGDPGLDGNILMSFYFRPGQLVLQEDCREILTVSSGLVTVDAADLPTGFLQTAKYDIHSAKSGAEIHAWSITPTAVGANTLTFAVADLDGSATGRKPVVAGDYVCLENQAALPGLPYEVHPVLAQAAVAVILESEGDDAGIKTARERLERQQNKSDIILQNRVDSSPQRVLNRGSVWWGGGSC